MIEDPVIAFALGNMTGSTFMMVVYQQWMKYKQEKVTDMIDEMAEGIDEEDLDL